MFIIITRILFIHQAAFESQLACLLAFLPRTSPVIFSRAKDAINPEYAAESNLPRVLGLPLAFHSLVMIVVILRLYTRMNISRSFGRDDLMMLLAMVTSFLGGALLLIVASYHGLGRHAKTIHKEDYQAYQLMGFIQSLVVTSASNMFVKFPVGFALLRICAIKHIHTTLRYIIWCLMGYVVAYTIFAVASLLAIYRPIEANWNKDVFSFITSSKLALDGIIMLIYKQIFYKFTAFFNLGSNMFTDICFASIPIPILWKLNLPRQTRTYLVGVLSLGYPTPIASAASMGLAKLVCQKVTRTDPDKSFHNWIQFFGFLENQLGIIAGSIPTFKPLLSKWIPFGSGHSTSSPYSYPDSRVLTGGQHESYMHHQNNYVRASSK
ncbi:Integral membrane protein [Apiospora phragmitis]|uniref:Integral membrane protein n=1 Tax=Apiospora phragmitis TaxID=2905665 RepID=A0ABR1UUW8_9PEZI